MTDEAKDNTIQGEKAAGMTAMDVFAIFACWGGSCGRHVLLQRSGCCRNRHYRSILSGQVGHSEKREVSAGRTRRPASRSFTPTTENRTIGQNLSYLLNETKEFPQFSSVHEFIIFPPFNIGMAENPRGCLRYSYLVRSYIERALFLKSFRHGAT